MHRFWFWARITAYLASFAQGAWVGIPQEDPSIPAALLVVTVLVAPLMLLFAVGVQVVNPLLAKQWERPRHHSNPLRLTHPLNFFHFAAFYMMAAGLGTLAHAVGKGRTPGTLDALALAFGIGILLGVFVFQRTFSRKMAPKSNRAD